MISYLGCTERETERMRELVLKDLEKEREEHSQLVQVILHEKFDTCHFDLTPVRV